MNERLLVTAAFASEMLEKYGHLPPEFVIKDPENFSTKTQIGQIHVREQDCGDYRKFWLE